MTQSRKLVRASAWKALALAAVLAAPATASAQHASSTAGSAHGSAAAGDIVRVASEAGSFNTLVAAVKAAGLVETLQGEGPFTVFAPNDAAFAKLPKATLDALLADRAALASVLTFHVVPGKVLAGDIVKAGPMRNSVSA